MRVATSVAVYSRSSHDISIHATHAGGDPSFARMSRCPPISIHATHAGGDAVLCRPFAVPQISIHATHAGGDLHDYVDAVAFQQFQSTPPMRVATVTKAKNVDFTLFQSTPPMRVATYAYIGDAVDVGISIHATHAGGDVESRMDRYGNIISIHATHAGGDSSRSSHHSEYRNFNPRHPCGWRLFPGDAVKLNDYFNPRHPCGWRLDVFQLDHGP